MGRFIRKFIHKIEKVSLDENGFGENVWEKTSRITVDGALYAEKPEHGIFLAYSFSEGRYSYGNNDKGKSIVSKEKGKEYIIHFVKNNVCVTGSCEFIRSDVSFNGDEGDVIIPYEVHLSVHNYQNFIHKAANAAGRISKEKTNLTEKELSNELTPTINSPIVTYLSRSFAGHSIPQVLQGNNEHEQKVTEELNKDNDGLNRWGLRAESIKFIKIDDEYKHRQIKRIDQHNRTLKR